jgi:Ras-related protein Rab-11A
MEAVNVEQAFQTIITEVYGIVNKKALAAKEAAAAAAPLPSQGKTISIDTTSGNSKRACCSS